MQKLKIIALGDSITYGYPFGHKYSWVELASQKLGIPIENSGINGNTLRDMWNRLVFDVLDSKPNYVILMGGANDVYQGQTLENLELNFLKIIKALEEHSIKIVLGMPPPIEDKKLEALLESFRSFLRKKAKKNKWIILDFYKAFLDPKKKTKKAQIGLLEDGVHPSAMGYRLMGEVASTTLTKMLKNS